MLYGIRRALFGNPLRASEEANQSLNKIQGLAVFSSDALSSVAYASEESMLVLMAAGASGLRFSLPIALVIAGLLAVVATSYHQTVHAYPSGGGAYTVAHENLGALPGLTAAAALLIAYVLTVAVSVAAGVAAITSAFPGLAAHRVALCLVAIGFVTWANLRGVRESGTLFSGPTYGFVFIFLGLICTGLIRLMTGSLVPDAAQTAPGAGAHLASLTALLVLRAFSSGCTALTGVEAISNGIPAFKKPKAQNAGRTLIAMAALLATMFLGISLLARLLHTVPVSNETLVSQIGRKVFGSGPLYLTLQAATTLILVLAANTSFAGFPRLAAILARAHYLPRQLANLGDRLVFANGMIALALAASSLIVFFGGQTHRLIPLYALGVFLSFTLSQTGMVRHWQKHRGRAWRRRALVNGFGAVATGIVVLVILVTKFTQGTWIVALLIPACIWVFQTIKHHYDSVAEQLSLAGLPREDLSTSRGNGQLKVVMPVGGLHRGTLTALHFARSLSKDITAVIVDVDEQVTARVVEKWADRVADVPLILLESPYRSTLRPLLAYLDALEQQQPEMGSIVVVLPQFVPARWWHNLLHNQTAVLIKTALTLRRGPTGKSRITIGVPYHLQR